MSIRYTAPGRYEPLCLDAAGVFAGQTGPATLSRPEEINGRLVFGTVICRDAKTLNFLSFKSQGVSRKSGKMWRIVVGIGLETSDDYGLSWTLRVNIATLGVVAATDIAIIGCQTLGSTHHFIYALKIDTTMWRLCHISTTNFTSWSTPIALTVGGAAWYVPDGSINRARLFKVGSNLLLSATYPFNLSSENFIVSSNGTSWTSSRTGTASQPIQVGATGRIYDYKGASSAYTDDGSSWTTFAAPTPVGTFFIPRDPFYAHGNFFILASNGTEFRLWKTRDLVNTAFAVTPIVTVAGELGIQTVNGFALAYAVLTGPMSLRYFQ